MLRVRPVRSLEAAAAAAIRRIRSHLLERLHPDGYWEDPLDCDTTVDSDYIFYLHVLGRNGPADQATVAALAARLRDQQLPDGGWNIHPGGPAEINATVKGYVALKMAGDPPDAPHMTAARDAALRLGGLPRTNSFARLYLSVLGLIDWASAPAIPPELMLLHRGLPFHIYQMSYWSRCILVPLSILWAKRFTVPVATDIAELLPGGSRVVEPKGGNGDLFSWRGLFTRTDRVLKWLDGRLGDANPLRRPALAAAEDWIVERFADSAGLGAIYPAMVNAVFALKALGRSDDDPLMRQAVAEVDALLVPAGADGGADRLRVLPCTSPVWNTALTVLALGISGLPADDPRMRAAGKWLLDHECRRVGDWSGDPSARGVEPSGWYFQFANGFYPDTDDTAMVLMALARVDLPESAPAFRRSLRWIAALQSRNGGWGAFDADNDAWWMTQVPFADHNAMIDPATADITGRILEMLGRIGAATDTPMVRRAVRFLRADQRPDGSWYGRWGVNYIYGTWQVLEGLAQVGQRMTAPWVRRAADRLESWQNADGGWGECISGYEEPEGFVPAESTPSQTAWAIMGLLAAGRADTPAVRHGIEWLVDNQTADGDWDETLFTGTGFPRVFYLKYPMYRKYFPLLALSKWRAAAG